MRIPFFLTVWALCATSAWAQVKPGYELYEKEDADQFRQRYTFTAPTIVAKPDTQVQVVNYDGDYASRFYAGNHTYVEADARLEEHIDRQIANNARRHSAQGYRIQLFSGTARAEALKVKGDFMSFYGDLPSYLMYISPAYRVRVGDYLDHDAAVSACAQIRRSFEGAFIVPDEVQLPKYKE